MRGQWTAMWKGWKAGRRPGAAVVLVTPVLAVLAAIGIYFAKAGHTEPLQSAQTVHRDPNSIDLTEAQLTMIEVGTTATHSFPVQCEALGSVDFNEDLAAQVFPPYQGRIVKLFAKIGDSVTRGQPLLTIESPDLIQAESTLIAAAGVLDLTRNALKRAQQLFTVEGIAEKDLQQAQSDQQTAEGAFKAAHDAVAVFGKSDDDIAHMVSARTIDPLLLVPSPISGKITARTAAPGDFVQPGNLPAPYAVADISRIWLNASVSEADMPQVRRGQKIRVTVMALPGRMFEGEISTVGASVDPQLHRGLVRAELEDPQHELLPGMFASFVILTGPPLTVAAIPQEGVVREGDGSMVAWFTSDRRHFTKQIVKIGHQDDGYDELLGGAPPGEQVVTRGAIFLDNLVNEDSAS